MFEQGFEIVGVVIFDGCAEFTAEDRRTCQGKD
jgi:hypothetical protein